MWVADACQVSLCCHSCEQHRHFCPDGAEACEKALRGIRSFSHLNYISQTPKGFVVTLIKWCHFAAKLSSLIIFMLKKNTRENITCLIINCWKITSLHIMYYFFSMPPKFCKCNNLDSTLIKFISKFIALNIKMVWMEP